MHWLESFRIMIFCHALIQSTTNWLHTLVTGLLSWAHLFSGLWGSYTLLMAPPSLPYRKAWCQSIPTINHRSESTLVPQILRPMEVILTNPGGELSYKQPYGSWHVWGEQQVHAACALRSALPFRLPKAEGFVPCSSGHRHMGISMIHVKTQNRWSCFKKPWQFPAIILQKNILPFLHQKVFVPSLFSWLCQ